MDKNLPYLVSISSYPADSLKGMKRLLKSLHLNVDRNSFELVLFGYAPQDYTVITDDFRMHRKYLFNEPYPGNLKRFDILYKMFEDGEMNQDRWIIFVDSFDVLFQAPLPNFEVFNDNEVLVADEGETWGENTWFPTLQEQVPNVKFIENLKDKNVLNAGTWAMKGSMFMAFYRFMQKRAKLYDYHQFSDQAIYNEFIYNSGIPTPLSHPTFCTVLYKNMELGNVIKKGSIFVNKNDDLFSIVHGNGSSKKYFDDGEQTTE